MEFAPFGQDGITLTREKKQNVECYEIRKKLSVHRVSKPSNFLTSNLLNFVTSQLLSFYPSYLLTHYLLPTTYYLLPTDPLINPPWGLQKKSISYKIKAWKKAIFGQEAAT